MPQPTFAYTGKSLLQYMDNEGNLHPREPEQTFEHVWIRAQKSGERDFRITAAKVQYDSMAKRYYAFGLFSDGSKIHLPDAPTDEEGCVNWMLAFLERFN